MTPEEVREAIANNKALVVCQASAGSYHPGRVGLLRSVTPPWVTVVFPGDDTWYHFHPQYLRLAGAGESLPG